MPSEIASDQAVGTHRLHTPEARRKSGRSRIANGGGSMLPTTDGRSLWARIRRDTYRAIVGMCGGVDMVSETQSLMARRVGTLEPNSFSSRTSLRQSALPVVSRMRPRSISMVGWRIGSGG
jgi:hypothetical protein